MATIINNPGENSSSGAGVIVGLVVAVILVAVIFIYGIPYLRSNNTGASNTPSANINVTLPGANKDNGGTSGY